MLGEKHGLLHDLPDHHDTIHHLKTSNGHFKRLFDDYHDLEHEVRRAEEGVEVHADDFNGMQKRKLLGLKDQLHQMILEHEKSTG